jgi:BlaI family transcriptional regulator, penicillinase repressor
VRKPAPPRDLPPPLELECLKALWKIGEGGVKEVREVLSANRQLAYTTVMTLLDRLARRGIVERRKAGRAFVYYPKLQLDNARRLAIKELVDNYFGGSEEALRQYLGGTYSNSPVEEIPSLDVSLL